jgi:D-alanyl-D-alanine carboxypeptidase/D-alanyl-D-alanine-endopeptidase (penicillin-binding protein 4)
VKVGTTFTPFFRTRVAFACCILNCAFLAASCGPKKPPGLATPPAFESIRRLQADLAAATKMPGVQHAIWGVSVRSLARSEQLFELNAHTLLVPASVAKLVSVATAAEAVGWDYRFTTTLRSSGAIDSGVLRGDLLIIGGGDPAIGGRGGDDFSSWIDALKSAGIHRVDGRIVGVDDAFEEPRPGFAWAWDDLGYSTGAVFGALNLAENRLAVTVTPGAVAGSPTTLASTADTPDLPITNRSVTGPAGSPALVWPEMRPGETTLTIAGAVPVGGMPATLLVSTGNPTAWFARMLRRRLIASGIEVTGPAADGDDVSMPPPDAAAVLYTYHSHTLSEIAQPLLKDSINLYAEAVQRLNAFGPSPHTNDQALDGIKQRLLAWGIPVDGFQIVDGSGLSRRDVASAEALLMVLGRMYDVAGASPWMRLLPVAGVDGTLAARMKGTPGENNVHAKTGTMSNVRSLAGYVTSRDGEPLAFVAIVNNFEGSGTQANAALDAIAVRLASFARGDGREGPPLH